MLYKASVIHVVTIGRILHGFQSKTMQHRRYPPLPKHDSEYQSEPTKTAPPF